MSSVRVQETIAGAGSPVQGSGVFSALSAEPDTFAPNGIAGSWGPAEHAPADLATTSEQEVCRRLDAFGRVPLAWLGEGVVRPDRTFFPADRAVYDVAKRAMDLVVLAVFAVPALLLMPLIALVVRLDSPGPVFYRQVRVGLHGSRFQIIKFRTMVPNAEANGAVYATRNDPRITRVGRILRKTRLDELPQLWNVLVGEMSLVGPRPERPEHTGMLEDILPGFAIRTFVKPGVTGWAQVRYTYAGTIEETRRKLEYDLYYVRRASLSLDFRILLRTVLVVLSFKGH